MFNNIGGKIKSLAKIVCWLGIISCIISGLPLILTKQQPLVLVGIWIAVVGSLFSWISSFILYGFGELVENSAIIAAKSKLSHSSKKQTAPAKTNAPKEVVNDDVFSNIPYIDIICPNCKEQLSYPQQELTDHDVLTCLLCNVSFKTLQYK